MPDRNSGTRRARPSAYALNDPRYERYAITMDSEFLLLAVSTFESASNKRGIMAAETERIVHRNPHFAFLRLVRRVIQVALRIGIFQIDGGRDDRIADGQRAGGHL